MELASNDPRDDLSLGEKELEILALYDRVYEQQLEEALLRQGWSPESPSLLSSE